LDGLKINEVSYLETMANKDFRIGSEFYEKPPFKYEHFKYVPIGDILKGAQYGLSIDMNEDENGYKIYRMNEIHDMLTDIDVAKHAEISKAELELFKLNDRDVLFNRTNSFAFVGRTGLYKKVDDEDFIFASYLIRFNPDESLILPEFLTAFLNTKLGIWDIKRRARQSINQSNVNAEEVKAIKIPLMSLNFQRQIKNCFDEANEKRLKSEKLYREAEELLLGELGLDGFEPSSEGIAVKSFSESFQTSGRLDAEYYQPKYDEIIAKIKSYHGGYKELGKISTLKKSIEPGSDAYGDEGVPFLRVADLSKLELKEPEIKLSKSLFGEDELKELLPKNGEVLMSKDGSVGIAYAMREDGDFIPSGAIVRLQKITDLLPDVLALLLNSQIVQLQAERDAGGSIIQHWKPSEINEVLLPLIDDKIQKTIAEKINKSFKLRTESKNLLEQAKKAVEDAIEKGEQNI
jgi:restriction endonuclease S subunit